MSDPIEANGREPVSEVTETIKHADAESKAVVAESERLLKRSIDRQAKDDDY
jgi:hypothetical protein